MNSSSPKVIGWIRLIGLLGFLLGIVLAIHEVTADRIDKTDVPPLIILMVGGAILFIGGARLPKLLKQ